MNTFGRKFKLSIFGESHGEAIGIVMDGVPAGLQLSVEDFANDIDRRRSGARGTTPRKEADIPEILSGLFDGHTTGAPLTLIFRNENTKSADYSAFTDQPRPGHADLVASVKWDGFNDPRGGGHFSGRLTLPLVAAGVVAKKVLLFANEDGDAIDIAAKIVALGGETEQQKMDAALDAALKDGDSIGGVVECEVKNMPIGIGEPFFDSVESVLAHAIFSIPGVRGVEFGDGFAAAGMRGSEHNDPIDENGLPVKNGAGGVNGGLSNGAPIKFRVAFKPTATIHKSQQTMNFKEGAVMPLQAGGRHDACFALRTPVVVEAMTAVVLLDLLLF